MLLTEAYPAEISYHITIERNLKATSTKYWKPKNEGTTWKLSQQ